MAEEKIESNKTSPVFTEKDVQKLSDMYHVPMSGDSIKGIVGDGIDEAKFKATEEYFKTAAQGLYPTFATQIKSGIPTAYLVDPYKQMGKQIIGEHYEPDFASNPRDAQALQGGTDPQTGRPAPMSLDQWRRTITTDSRFGYDGTPHAISAAHETMTKLGQAMQTTPNMEK